MGKKRINCLRMGISARLLYLIIFKPNAAAHHIYSRVPAVSQLLHQKRLKKHISFREWINWRPLCLSLYRVSLIELM